MFIKIKQRLGISLLLASTCITLAPSYAQEHKQNWTKKIIKKFLSSESDSSRSASLMVLPALGYAQETGVEYGLAGIYNFYLDKTDPTSRTSNIMLMGTLTSKQQKNIKLQTDLWTRNSDYHIISELRYRDWPFNFYGIGQDTWKADEDLVAQKFTRARIEVEKKIIPKLYLGLNANFEHYQFNDREAGGIFDQPNILGKKGGRDLALGVSALYDSRNNTTYTTSGFYSRIKYSYAPNFWGGSNFSGSQLEADLRSFQPISKPISLAIQVIYRGTFGHKLPFYSFYDLGGDMSMRGYYLGRYKDKNYATAQAELRYRFMARFGIVGFAGTGSTFSKEHAIRLVPSFGTGLRYFFSLEHNSSVRLDYAIGEQRPGEKRQAGFYLSVSEAF